MKFTEEQYRAIVEAWESEFMYENKVSAVKNRITTIHQSIDEALALANPATREWAHGRFDKEEI